MAHVSPLQNGETKLGYDSRSGRAEYGVILVDRVAELAVQLGYDARRGERLAGKKGPWAALGFSASQGTTRVHFQNAFH
ncbi:MAG: hypothetical protein ACOVS5_03720 [Oligoflexus sp.]|jgi:hypothetical protein